METEAVREAPGQQPHPTDTTPKLEPLSAVSPPPLTPKTKVAAVISEQRDIPIPERLRHSPSHTTKGDIPVPERLHHSPPYTTKGAPPIPERHQCSTHTATVSPPPLSPKTKVAAVSSEQRDIPIPERLPHSPPHTTKGAPPIPERNHSSTHTATGAPPIPERLHHSPTHATKGAPPIPERGNHSRAHTTKELNTGSSIKLYEKLVLPKEEKTKAEVKSRSDRDRPRHDKEEVIVINYSDAATWPVAVIQPHNHEQSSAAHLADHSQSDRSRAERHTYQNTRSIQNMSVEALRETFLDIGLLEKADVFSQRRVDGEILLSMSEDMLCNAPFSLTSFEFLQVERLREGKFPKRDT